MTPAGVSMADVNSLPDGCAPQGEPGKKTTWADAAPAPNARVNAMTNATVTNNSMRLISAASLLPQPPRVMGCLLRLYKEDYGAPFGLPHCQNYLICAVGGT